MQTRWLLAVITLQDNADLSYLPSQPPPWVLPCTGSRQNVIRPFSHLNILTPP
jgi:hypothetical protein